MIMGHLNQTISVIILKNVQVGFPFTDIPKIPGEWQNHIDHAQTTHVSFLSGASLFVDSLFSKYFGSLWHFLISSEMCQKILKG